MTTQKNPLVSVIMPIHNRFDLVNQAVDSVINQTYRPIELLIVDDVSDSIYIPEQQYLGRFEVKVIRLEKNSGPGASRETGRLAAKGDYLAYLDSDDLWHPQKLERQIEELLKHPETGMCYCQTLNFSELPLTGNEIIRLHSDQQYAEFLPIILEGRPWHTSSCVWTREATEKIGPWMDGWHFEDLEYDVRAGCSGISISYVPEVLCYARKSDDSLTAKSDERKLPFTISSVIQISKDLRAYNILKKNNDVKDKLLNRLSRLLFNSIGRVNERILSKLIREKALVVDSILRKTVLFFLSILVLMVPQRGIVKWRYWFRKLLVS